MYPPDFLLSYCPDAGFPSPIKSIFEGSNQLSWIHIMSEVLVQKKNKCKERFHADNIKLCLVQRQEAERKQTACFSLTHLHFVLIELITKRLIKSITKTEKEKNYCLTGYLSAGS